MSSILAWLMAGHLAGDFLLQNRWMAENKSGKLLPLLAHSAVYTGAVWLASLPCGGLGLWGTLLVLVSHAALDNRKFVFWWNRAITKGGHLPCLLTMTDQAWHVVFLALACALENKI
jgi:hypothetical protein